MTRTYSGALTFTATSGTKTITSNSISLASINLNGAGGTFQLADTLEVKTFIRTNGSFDANGQLVLIDVSNGFISGTFTGSNSFFDLTFDNSLTTTNAYQLINISNNITITNNFVSTGASVINRIWILTSNPGIQITITAANVSITNTDFMDIVAAGAGVWSGTSIGDALGNTGITFTAPVTRYWVDVNGGSWSATSSWSASSGGASGASVPLCHDTVIFDANSITAGASTILADISRLGVDLDFTNILNSPTFDISAESHIFGDLTLIAAMTWVNSSSSLPFNLRGRSAHTLTTAGNNLDGSLSVSTPGGSYTMQDDLVLVSAGSLGLLRLLGGTLDSNNFDITVSSFPVSGSILVAHNLVLGSSTFFVEGATGQTSSFSAYGSGITAGTSLIMINDPTNNTFSFGTTGAGSNTYNNVWFSRGVSTGNIFLSGASLFNDFKDDGSVAHTIILPPTALTTVSSFSVIGSLGNLISIRSNVGGNQADISMSSGRVCSDYLDLLDTNVFGGATWKAGINSVDSGNNTGWSFTSCPGINGQFLLCF